VFTGPGRKALIPYVTVGYPSIEATLKVVPLLADSGADIIELGIPFSDPLADGTTIQQASHQALLNGVTPKQCLEIARELSGRVSTPLVFMTYYNPVFDYGLAKFSDDCLAAGISGLIIPDLPPEEGADLETVTRAKSLDLIYLLAPTSTVERVRLVAERSGGFIYLVSITGVTGARDSLPTDMTSFVSRVRTATTLPLCVGFGISSPEQAADMARIADGVIVGSRIVQLMDEDNGLERVSEFIRSLRRAIDAV
jgi:tryptophan synthase alpha chain